MTDGSHGYPKRPENEDHIGPRSKFDICQSAEDFAHIQRETEHEIDEVLAKIRRMVLIFELAMIALFIIFAVITGATNSELPIGGFVWLLAFNLLYLIILFDPVKKESEISKHETDWDVKIFQLRERLRYEKTRFMIGLFIGGAFCLAYIITLFIVDVIGA